MYERTLNPVTGRLGDEKLDYRRQRRVPGTRTAFLVRMTWREEEYVRQLNERRGNAVAK